MRDSLTIPTCASLLVQPPHLPVFLPHLSGPSAWLPTWGPIIAPPQGTREGDTVICPSCTGEFVLHVVGDTFDLEWRGAGRGVYRPRPDMAAIDEVLGAAPPVVDVPPKRDD